MNAHLNFSPDVVKNRDVFREVYFNKIEYCFGSLYLFHASNKVYSHWDSYRKSNIVIANYLRLELREY